MTSCQAPRSCDGDLPLVGKRQLADIKAVSSKDARGVQGRRQAPPSGREALEAARIFRHPQDAIPRRAAKTTDDRGRFDDESR
jgi:hypothetical protein